MSETLNLGIEQARSSLGDLVLTADRGADLKTAITMISRYGRDVAAIVPAAVAVDAIASDGQPHAAETYGIALTIQRWHEHYRGTELTELPERELGRVLGFAEALHAATHRGNADIYTIPHPATATPDRLEWVNEMLALADDVVAEWTAWVHPTT